MQGVGASPGSWGSQNVAPTLLAFPLVKGAVADQIAIEQSASSITSSYSGRIVNPVYPAAPISGPSRPATSSSAGTRIGVIRLLTLNQT